MAAPWFWGLVLAETRVELPTRPLQASSGVERGIRFGWTSTRNEYIAKIVQSSVVCCLRVN